MEDEQVIPAPEEKEEKSALKASEKKLSRKDLIIILAIVLIAIVGGGASFWYGYQKKKAEPTPSPSPSPTAISTPTPEETEEPEASPTQSPTSTASPTPTPTPEIQTKTIKSTASLDGFRASNGGGNAGIEIRAGRNINLAMRGFVSFDLSGIPEGATIQEVALRLYQYNTVGDPYGVGGSLKMDHLDYGNSLGNEDYGASSISSSFTTLTSNAVVEWKDADVTDAVKDDLANDRERSQYRIHFQIESIGGNAAGDFAYFESADNSEGTGNTPQLVVKYY